ncbi:substrate-binding periplasmic protein [Campylobacter corcagiensis]|uniref:Amino acid ABC transporter substrate-binding protein n=1 Tax=Campylobacter corcagiensis TaxID=1448857 RepID=A0A7M1LGM9_9BACT|nr:ABC transporter substrate-binding protein [Campylobacter corcagiensis]QKF64205.1 amino acid ABC transporter, periplasmic arginine/lysine/histidine-binding protein [Campylobacter corcagiensis]QOQ87600.1 amino acid ABC transporter substrate-binding protein [Campylobacter corcagiensis]
MLGRAFGLVVFAMILVANAKVLKVGTQVNYEPFAYVGVNFKLMGFEPDLLEEISKKAGFEYEFVTMEYDELIPALVNNKIDIIASSMSITSQRMDKVNFTNPYYNSSTAYVKLKSRDDIGTKDDLAGKNIGVMEGREQEILASKIPNAKVKPVKNGYSGIMLLESGSVDVLMLDEAVGDHYARKSVNKEVFLVEEYVSLGFAFAVSKDGDPELINSLNMALDELMLDGTYDELLKKYNLIKGKI